MTTNQTKTVNYVRLLPMIAVLATPVMLAGCGSDDTPVSTTTTTQQTSP